MKTGIVFPNEIGADPEAVVRFAKTADKAGFRFLATFDHVVGADTATRPDWKGTYTSKHLFHEPLILFAYLAALTDLEFMTNVLVLPQRQTVLVAKQATELDILSGGRLRLGVGLGWNPVEYEALGVDFARRGARFEEQITLLRALWANQVIDFDGTYHRVDRAGILPLPARGRIPVWIGTFGKNPSALARIGRLADGWGSPGLLPGPDLKTAQRIIGEAATEAGRDPASIEFEGRIHVPAKYDAEWVHDQIAMWAEAGATHVLFDTLHVGLTAAQHIERAAEIGEICSGQV